MERVWLFIKRFLLVKKYIKDYATEFYHSFTMSQEEATQSQPSTLVDFGESIIDQWLCEISTEEHRINHLLKIQERIDRTLNQIRYEGFLSIYDFERLKYIGQQWIDLINLLSVNETEKNVNAIVCCLLRLYDCAQLSKDLFGEIITLLL